MAGEIFISYRRADQAKAQLLWRLLQDRGVDAWYDQHVPSGEDWRAATANALVAAPIFVLMFSKSASQSDDIAKELGAATFQKKLVIPVRLEDIHPEGAFLYELASRNWFDAFEDTDARLGVLADRLAALVHGGKEAQDAAIKLGTPGAQKLVAPDRRDQNRRDRKERREKKKGINIYAIGGLIIAGLAIVSPKIRDVLSPDQHPSRTAIVASSQRIAFFGFTADGDDEAATAAAKAATDQGFRLFSVRQADTAARADTADRVDAGDDKDDRLSFARKAGARYALSGEIRSEGGRIHAAMHLEDVATRTTLWDDTYEGDTASAATQIGIRAAEVTFCASTLGYTRFSARDVDAALIAPAATSCAEFGTGSNAGISGALRYARELASRYPDDALTQARLAYLAVETMTFAAPAAKTGLLEEAKAAEAKAVALDPDGYATAVARLSVGLGENQPPSQWASYAESSLKRSPKMGEAFYYGLANRQAGIVLGALGRHKAALPYFEAATEGDPFSPFSNLTNAYTLAAAGQPGAAAKFDAMLAQRRTTYGWDYALGASLFLGAGDAERLLAAPPVDTTPASVACWRDIQTGLKQTDPAARRAAAARADACLVWDLQPTAKMQALAMLGDIDGVFTVLDRPDISHYLMALDISPLLFPSLHAVHVDKRFAPLMQKLGYVDYWKQTKTRPDICSAANAKEIPLCAALGAAN